MQYSSIGKMERCDRVWHRRCRHILGKLPFSACMTPGQGHERDGSCRPLNWWTAAHLGNDAQQPCDMTRTLYREMEHALAPPCRPLPQQQHGAAGGADWAVLPPELVAQIYAHLHLRDRKLGSLLPPGRCRHACRTRMHAPQEGADDKGSNGRQQPQHSLAWSSTYHQGATSDVILMLHFLAARCRIPMNPVSGMAQEGSNMPCMLWLCCRAAAVPRLAARVVGRVTRELGSDPGTLIGFCVAQGGGCARGGSAGWT